MAPLASLSSSLFHFVQWGLEPIGLDLAGLAPPRMQKTRCCREEGEDVQQELPRPTPRVGRRGLCRPPELSCAQAEAQTRHHTSEEEAALAVGAPVRAYAEACVGHWSSLVRRPLELSRLPE